jgi:hypothetical protein
MPCFPAVGGGSGINKPIKIAIIAFTTRPPEHCIQLVVL